MKYKDLNEEEKEKFGLYVRKLLKTSFISEDSDENGYYYIQSHDEVINKYLRVIGYELNLNREIQVVGIREVEQEGKMPFSLKASLKKYQTLILICIWELYGEKIKSMSDEDEFFFEISDLNTMLDTYYTARRLTAREWEETLKLFEKHNLIEVIGKDYTNANTRVRMFSTLNLCLETSEYKKVKDEWEKACRIEKEEDKGEEDGRETA